MRNRVDGKVCDHIQALSWGYIHLWNHCVLRHLPLPSPSTSRNFAQYRSSSVSCPSSLAAVNRAFNAFCSSNRFQDSIVSRWPAQHSKKSIFDYCPMLVVQCICCPISKIAISLSAVRSYKQAMLNLGVCSSPNLQEVIVATWKRT